MSANWAAKYQTFSLGHRIANRLLPQTRRVCSLTNSFALLLLTFLVASCSQDGEAPSLSAVGPDLYDYDCTAITNNSNSGMGMNLISLNYYNNSQWVFVDAMLKSRETWVADSPSAGWDGGSITSYDSNGWPTGVSGDTRPTTQLFTSIEGSYPTGTYVVHWEGNGGVLGVDGAASNIRCADGASIDACTNREAYFDVNSATSEGIILSITPSSASSYSSSNYIRNIRVIMPGGVCGLTQTALDPYAQCTTSRGGSGSCSSGYTCYDFNDVHWNRFSDSYADMETNKLLFHPATMAKLRQFRAVRYQEFMKMQGTTVTSWASRTGQEEHTWAGTDGVPPEITVHMSNILNADPWMNIPHLAEDGYVNSLATYYLNNLDSDLHVYLEYSNEPWNPSVTDFTQSQYFLDQANTLGVGVGEQDYIRKSLVYVDRAVEIFGLWDDTFPLARTTRTIAGWAGFNDVAPAMLGRTGVSGNVDALAVAAYFGTYLPFAEFESTVQNWSKESVFREFNESLLGADDAPNGALAQTLQMITDHAAIASQYNVDLVGYETGGHLWAEATETNSKMRTLFRSVVDDSRFGQYYLDIFDHWVASGGKLLNGFALVQSRLFDQFGTYQDEYTTCDDSVKAGAINQWMINNSCWWDSCSR